MPKEKEELKVIVNRHDYRYVANDKWREYRGASYEEYRKKWYEYPTKRYLSSFPLHMDLDITNACNLKCKMCARTIMSEQGILPDTGFMDFEFFKHLMDQGVSAGLASVKFNFQGEPLLHPMLVEMIRYAKNAGIIDTMINTNGTLLTKEKSDDLLDAGLDNIFFSIDSPYKETCERIRIGVDYDQVIENIEQFITLKNKKNKHGVQTGVVMILLKDNMNELEDFKKLWKNKVDTISWGPDQNYILKNNEYKDNNIYRSIIPGYCCAQLWQRIFIMWDGTCIPCCIDSKKELIVGNAKDTSIQKIWLESHSYKKLREYHNKNMLHKIDLCNRCPFPLADSDM